MESHVPRRTAAARSPALSSRILPVKRNSSALRGRSLEAHTWYLMGLREGEASGVPIQALGELTIVRTLLVLSDMKGTRVVGPSDCGVSSSMVTRTCAATVQARVHVFARC